MSDLLMTSPGSLSILICAALLAAELDRLRRQHCQSLAGLVTTDTQRAKTLGDLVHAVFVGSQQCQPPYTAAEIKAIYRELQHMLVTPVSNTIDQAELSS